MLLSQTLETRVQFLDARLTLTMLNGFNGFMHADSCAHVSRPGRNIAALRGYLRVRERLLEYAAAHIQHMQKAMTFMNLQLHHVVTDITGVTGMRIMRAIVRGERDAEVLAAMRDVRVSASAKTVKAALIGNYQPEHLFALKQAIELYDFYQTRVDDCDVEIEHVLTSLKLDEKEPIDALPAPRHKTRRPNAISFDTRPPLH